MREKKHQVLQHVVVYVEYVVYLGHPHVELQLMLFLWQNPLTVQICSNDDDTPSPTMRPAADARPLPFRL